MRNILRGLISLLTTFFCFVAYADKGQRPAIKFGDIKPSDFETQIYSIDSNAQAVVLSDVGSSKYEADNKGGFNIVFKRHFRVRILNRNAFDVATVSIPVYAAGSLEERIVHLEAATYTYENGQVTATKLDKGSIFKDKLSKNYTLRKFTMPNLKEGCIVDIQYTLSSPYERDLRSWQFQGGHPVLWSEYKVTVPSVYDFVIIRQGYHPYATDTAVGGTETYNILIPGETAADRSEVFSFRTSVATSTWAMQNIPAIKKENFTTTIDNHVARLDFQLSKIRFPNVPVKNVLHNWVTVATDLLKDPDFGEGLTKNLNWIEDDLKSVTAGASTNIEKAKKIYEYVRDNYSCTNHSAKFLANPLKKVYQGKAGNVAELNLLLTAILIKHGFEAKPVMLSTRDYGKAYESYPVMDKLNYVISRVKVDDQYYLLDASYNKLGFGKLYSDCYNGYARIIDPMPLLIDLSPDSLVEAKLTTAFIINDEKGGLVGSVTSNLGYNESFDLREKLVKTTQEEFFKDLKKGYGFDIEMSNTTIEALKEYDQSAVVKYDIKFSTDEDIIYLNPLFTEGQKSNPFAAAERFYPVEMPYAVNETFILRMDIPKGYKVEELPKSTRVKFNEDEGMFEYLVSSDANLIQLRTKIQLNKATFLPEDYQSLREFFGFIVKKHSEQIVLKKIK